MDARHASRHAIRHAIRHAKRTLLGQQQHGTAGELFHRGADRKHRGRRYCRLPFQAGRTVACGQHDLALTHHAYCEPNDAFAVEVRMDDAVILD